jgi:hypothetical protein
MQFWFLGYLLPEGPETLDKEFRDSGLRIRV